jgi:di/tricarboxylate transporter
MFDFAPVGVAIAGAGILYLALLGWRLIPRREGDDGSVFGIEGYLTEVVAPENALAVGMRVREVGAASGGAASVVALVRGEHRFPAPSGWEVIAPNDVLVLEADVDELSELISDTGLVILPAHEALEEAAEDAVREASGLPPAHSLDSRALLNSDEVELLEVVVRPGGLLSGRSAAGVRLRERYGVNLVAIARQGGAVHTRLNEVRIQRGDVLLLQVPREFSSSTLALLGCLPLAERGLRFRAQPRVLLAILIFGVALFSAAILGVIPIELAVTIAALAMGVTGLVTLREAYEAIDWPILVLLGAMLPVGAALETTGAAARLAGWLVQVADGMPEVVVIGLVLIVAMMLSDVVNNAAAAVLLIPIAMSTAEGLGISEDALLMAVAIGASSAFLTPIGHQSNVLVMGPGGYQFGDYWRVGLLLEVVIVLVASPLLMIVWG